MRILLISDREVEAREIEGLLGEHPPEPYDLDTAVTAAEAKRALKGGGFDVVVLDYGGADANPGRAVRDLVRRAHGKAVIVLADDLDAGSGQEMLGTGAQEFLVRSRLNSDALWRTMRYAFERASVRKTLLESEKRFYGLFENSGDGLVVLKDDGTVLDVNPAAGEIMGRPEAQLVGSSFGYPLVAGETTEMEILKPGGKLRQIEMRTFNVEWEGRPAAFAILRDITERNRAEWELREREREKSRLLSNLPGFAYRCRNDEKWTMEFISDGCMEVLGYLPVDLVGNSKRSYADLIHPDDRRSVWDAVQKQVKDGLSFKFEYRIITRDKRERWVWEKGIPVFHDGTVHLEGFISDITARKHAEMEQEEALKRFEAIINNTPAVAIQGVDADGVVRHWNPACEALYGYTAEEVIGKRVQDVLFDEASAKAFERTLAQIVQTGTPIPPGEWAVRTKDGRERCVYSSLFPVLNEGAIDEIFCMDVDITESREMRENLRRARDELLVKNEELKKLDEFKDNIISSVSHEFRTPLAVVKEYLQLIIDGTAGKVDEQAKRMLVTADLNIDRLTRLLNSVLDISKLDTGEISISKEPVDLAALVRRVSEYFSAKFETSGLECRLRLPPEPVIVTLDEDKIIQVLTNLIGNALKYTEEGWVELAVVDLGEDVECSVSDSGIGIPPDDLPKIFDRFFQTNHAGGKRQGGTGLGLPIARSLVEMHGGELHAESEFGKGTKVFLRLPKHRIAQNP